MPSKLFSRRSSDSGSMGSGQSKTQAKGNKTQERSIQDGLRALDTASSELCITAACYNVQVRVTSEHYFRLVHEAWEQLRATQFKASQQFSLAEWLHVHALMLFGRIQQVNPHDYGEANHINVDPDTQVFSPIWTALSAIGIVHDTDLCIRYIPDARVPSAQSSSSYTPKDLAHILDGTLYDWNRSWIRVAEARYERDRRHVNTSALPPSSEEELLDAIATKSRQIGQETDSSNRSVLEQEVAGLIQRLRDSKDHTMQPAPRDVLESAHSDGSEFDLSISEGAGGSPQTGYTSLATHCDCFVHYDPQIWQQYHDFIMALISSRAAQFMPFPSHSEGNIAWLLPVTQKSRSVSLRLPHAKVSRRDMALAVLLRTVDLPVSIASSWHAEAEGPVDVGKLLENFVQTGMRGSTHK